MAAASNDLAVTEAFLHVLGLTAPTSRLLRPSMMVRVINGNRRKNLPQGDPDALRRDIDNLIDPSL